MMMENKNNINIDEETMISSLDGVKIINERRVGNSTRIIDNAIQQLFSKKQVVINDHFDKEFFLQKEFIVKRIAKRLLHEHRISGKDIFKIRYKNYLIMSLK